jgi:hypothetical protein
MGRGDYTIAFATAHIQPRPEPATFSMPRRIERKFLAAPPRDPPVARGRGAPHVGMGGAMNENTTEGPLTATVGERLGEKARLAEEAVGRARPTERRFPWAAVLAGSVVWMLVRSVTRGVGRRLRRRR